MAMDLLESTLVEEPSVEFAWTDSSAAGTALLEPGTENPEQAWELIAARDEDEDDDDLYFDDDDDDDDAEEYDDPDFLDDEDDDVDDDADEDEDF